MAHHLLQVQYTYSKHVDNIQNMYSTERFELFVMDQAHITHMKYKNRNTFQ